jgi:formylglycine-generating enzyme required for sulfatase activity
VKLRTPIRTALLALGFCGGLWGWPCEVHSQLVTMPTVAVGDPGNVADTNGFGRVNYAYDLGKFEVTLGQYTTFLNAVASNNSPPWLATLWSPAMASDDNSAGILRNGSGSGGDPFRYTVKGDGNRPVAYVSWLDAARFANWLHNGATNGASTETGAYPLNGATNAGTFSRSTAATWWVPTEDEWYKAAYYKGGTTSSGYWAYPTGSDTAPGNLIGPLANQANYYAGTYSTTQAPDYLATENYLTPVGAFSGSPSPYGTLDQGGNLLEWTDSGGYPTRGLRGGYWTSLASALSSSKRFSDYMDLEWSVAGFRVASAVGPRFDSTDIHTVRRTGSILELGWTPAMKSDPDVRRVVDIQTRASLTSGAWQTLALSNISGTFRHTNGTSRGYYRLKASSLPFALVGPEAESITQGLRLITASAGDVLYFGPASGRDTGLSGMEIWVDGTRRGLIEYAPSREGTAFLFQPAGTTFLAQTNFRNGAAFLDSPAFTAADAGSTAARQLVADLVRRYPDSVTVWQNIGGSVTNEATVLYARVAATLGINQGARPGQFGFDVAYMGQPLVSGGALVPAGDLRFGLPYAVNLNETNATRPVPFVGARSGGGAQTPVTGADWVYLAANGQPTNISNAPTMRYAFWVEDESFKVNLNTATNGVRGPNSVASGPQEVRIDGSWQTSSNPLVAAANVQALVSNRAAQPGGVYSNVESAAAIAGVTDPQALAEVRFLSTVNSGGHDLSRGGAWRFDINSITNGEKSTALLRFTTAITNSNAAPIFGQRFYRLANSVPGINATNAVTGHHASIYLQKLAANVYDYLDDDDQPSIVNNDAAFTLRTGRPSRPIEPLGGGVDGSNSIAAMGVENLPRLQEYAIHVRVRSMRHDPNNPDSFGYNSTNASPPVSAAYEVWIDHYFEFWNPGIRDITLTNAFLKVCNQPAWGTNVTGPLGIEGRDTSEIPLTNVTFPAGRVTVLTTAPVQAVNLGPIAGSALINLSNASNVVLLPTPDADRIFTGTTADVRQTTYNSSGVSPSFPYDRLFDLTLRPRSSSTADYRTGIILGTDLGIVESFTGLPVTALSGETSFSLCISNGFLRDNLTILAAGNNDNLRVSVLAGNTNAITTPSTFEGDPRALNEQLELLNFTPISGADASNSTRFFSALSAGLPGGNTMGAPNTNYVNPARWLDSSSMQPGASNAPLVVRNGAMHGIGELGHITDPARPYYTSGSVPVLARGGGRTLRVGQAEFSTASGSAVAWYMASNQTNASRTWTSWRLTDIFSAGPASTNTVRGRINPNGVLRDNGAALQAAFFGLTFQPSPEGAPQIAGRPVLISNVVSNMMARISNGNAAGLGFGTMNPFWERGEISELSVFNSSTSSTLAPGATMSNAFDRGREELVRRSLEMITTRGSIFTVYVIGQSIQMTNFSTNVVVLDTRRMKKTFELLPQFQYPSESANDSFYPRDSTQVIRRFLAPTNYETRVLSTVVD